MGRLISTSIIFNDYDIQSQGTKIKNSLWCYSQTLINSFIRALTKGLERDRIYVHI